MVTAGSWCLWGRDLAEGASFAVDISGPVSLSPAVAPANTVGLYTCLFTLLKCGAPLTLYPLRPIAANLPLSRLGFKCWCVLVECAVNRCTGLRQESLAQIDDDSHKKKPLIP